MAERRWRIQQRQATAATSIPSSIGFTAATSTTVPSALATAPSTSFAQVTLTDSAGQTTIRTVVPTDVATSSNAHSTATPASTASAAGSTSTSTSKDGSSNMSILIPAIVAPIAAVLLLSFVAFWIYMRRRQKKAIEDEPEFVMEGMKEKPRSRPATADSNSSTKELVSNKSKDPEVSVKEVERSALADFSFNNDANNAPPRVGSALDSRPSSRQADQSGKNKSIPNFSRGPRPSTAGRDSTASPAPPHGQEERNGSRSGQQSLPGKNGPRPNTSTGGPGRGEPPRVGPGHRPVQTRNGSFSRPLAPPMNVNRGPPSAAHPRQARPGQDDAQRQPPPGAYNGTSPISQYSPIVKNSAKFSTSSAATKSNPQSRTAGGSVSSINDQGVRKPPPSAIKTGSSPVSPADPNFSEENVRIARLANSSRLAFHSVVATTAATSPATEEPPTPSPRLPPPATRDAPPTNYNIPLPSHEPPAPASVQSRLNGVSISDRRSVVSGLSDDYVDMEVDDNKSDVSSLDEREKWQLQSETDMANTQKAGLGGYGGLGPRPPLLSSQNSEASGSQYSLGYYAKDNTRADSR